jgi:thiosulfate reductase cytochrome b subunit
VLAKFRPIHLTWLIPAAVLLAAAVVLGANLLRATPGVQAFIEQFPGASELPAGTPVGFPAWLSWQHFLSAFFLLFIIRTGWQVRTMKRPAAYWTRKNTGAFKTANPPVRIGLHVWLHLSMDILWVLNGLIFYVLLFSTGQWARIVPTSWDIVPNAVSVAIQYASFDWPTENGWINYNALQVLAYFATVFIAAPLAIITGIRTVPGLAGWWRRFDRVYPVGIARAIHYPVMIYFVLFIIAHVTLVFATGALRNLNHMYAGRDDESWWGVGIFALSLLAMGAAWFVLRPPILGSIAALTGNVRR